jgi:hypothetical protein
MKSTMKPGQRLTGVADDTEVVVVRAPTGPVEVSCGGHPMIGVDEDRVVAAIDPSWAEGTLLGKRYGNEELGLEVLCTRAGTGSLAVDGIALVNARAKPLPASD